MPFRVNPRERFAALLHLLKWTALTLPVGIAVGSACALFLWSLEEVTRIRLQQPNLLFLLPVAGMGIAWLYLAFGKSAEAGNNLIVDEIHEPGGGIPLRMAPLVLIGTVITHLFGGSAGREGTAVQMGGALAHGVADLFPRMTKHDVRTLLTTGVAAGFAGVFGTPIAGTIFALEVLAIGRMSYTALLPCLMAAMISDKTCTMWGVGHTYYSVGSMLPAGALAHLAPLDPVLLAKVAAAAMLFGLASVLFAELTHGFGFLFKQFIRWPMMRPAIGGGLVIGLVYLLDTRDYLGLGVTSPDPDGVSIVSAFRAGGANHWSWLLKIVFTALTLASGFKGGEVTPLFFIGATLGNTLALLLGAPVDLFAAIGFVAVFAGATNTPIACTVMAVELFGAEYVAYFATACIVAYQFSGHTGIYLSQRIGVAKPFTTEPIGEGTTLRTIREAQPSPFRINQSASTKNETQ